MTIGPAPMIKIEEMSVRFGIGSGLSAPLPKFVKHRGTPLTRTSEAKGH
jgi:hypothetical protein